MNHPADEALAFVEMLFSDGPVAAAFLDREMRPVRINPVFAAIRGIPPEDHVGNHRGDHLRDHLGAAADVVEPLLKDLLEGRSSTITRQLRVPQSEGGQSVEWLAHEWLAHFYAVRSNNGEILGVGILAIDITARINAEEARSRADSQLRVALSATRMGVWRWNLVDPTEVSWSDTTAELLGLSADAPPTPERIFGAMDDSDRFRMDGSIRRALAAGEPYEKEFRVVWPDDTVHWLLAKGHVQELVPGSREMVGVIVDVSDQRARSDESVRLAMRQTRAGELAIRMQRVTAALAQAVTVADVCEVLLGEGANTVNAQRRIVALLTEDGANIETLRFAGYSDADVQRFSMAGLDADTPLAETLRTGQPSFVSADAERSETIGVDKEAYESSENDYSVAVFPISIHGRTIGAWSLSWAEARSHEEGELIILLTLAANCASALERARIYDRERAIATMLQQNLFPQQMPTVRDASTAVRYRPGTAGIAIGGDWYDVMVLSDNRLIAVIGDVGGHNIDSATVMAQLRHTVRSYAWEGHPPSTVLELTNRLLSEQDLGVLATCCYVDLNLDDGIASVALAGHPPPLLRSPTGEVEFVDLSVDPPLGTDAQRKYEQGTLFFTSGDTLILYTDGMIESRSTGVSQGMERLASVARSAGDTSPEPLADQLLQSLQQNVEDDVALLVLRYEPQHTTRQRSETRSVKRHLPSSAASAGVARRFTSDVLRDWGASDLVDQVSLCVSELVTNALIHTATDVELVLRLAPTSVRVEVIDRSDRLPVLRAGANEDTSGRGLHIVEAVASDWGVDTALAGKSVWFQLDR